MTPRHAVARAVALLTEVANDLERNHACRDGTYPPEDADVAGEVEEIRSVVLALCRTQTVEIVRRLTDAEIVEMFRDRPPVKIIPILPLHACPHCGWNLEPPIVRERSWSAI